MLTTTFADPWVHLQSDIEEARQAAKENKNNSADWWRARLSGLEHAVEVFRHHANKEA